jgi:hypothetical protein
MDYDEIAIGDEIEVRINNPIGDRNLDGGILRGKVIEKYEPHRMVKLHTGWCCHEKDTLLTHVKGASMTSRERGI